MQSQPQPKSQSREEKLFFNSLSSEFTKTNYKVYLDKYLQVVGYKDLNELLAKQPKEIENDLIDFIISLKERGCKHSTIINYVKPLAGCCKVNDIVLNVNKVNRFMPKYVRNKNTRGYDVSEIQAMLDVADERMRIVILLASSCGLRIGSIPDLSIGSCLPVQDLYKISVYDGDPESYMTFCSNKCKKAIDVYISMRSRYGEDISKKSSPLIRGHFNPKRDRMVAFKLGAYSNAKETETNMKILCVALAICFSLSICTVGTIHAQQPSNLSKVIKDNFARELEIGQVYPPVLHSWVEVIYESPNTIILQGDLITNERSVDERLRVSGLLNTDVWTAMDLLKNQYGFKIEHVMNTGLGTVENPTDKMIYI
jgi:hypothetical protein